MLGVISLDTGDLDRAIAFCDRAIRHHPLDVAAHLVRGHAELRRGRYAAAARSYADAIAIAPNLLDPYLHRGEALRAAGEHEAAVESYRRAIALAPERPETHFECGVALAAAGRLESARESYARSLALRADYADAHLNLGNVLKDLHRLEEAIASYDRAIACRPDFAVAYSNRGNLLAELDRTTAAFASYGKALELQPDLADAFTNRANLHQRLGAFDAALADYDRAIAAKPDSAAAHQYRGYALLARGDFETGWVEHEWRWKNEHGSLLLARREFRQALWSGEQSLEGKSILLHSEQGLGDTLQFCRYAQLVADRGGVVVLEVPAQLERLLGGLAGVSTVVARGEPLPAFDLHCPLMSLPAAFRTTVSTMPARIPYIEARRDQCVHWRAKLGEPRKPRVGIVWSGGFRPQHPELWSVNERRNIPLAKLAPLARADVEFYTLQKGLPAETELAEAKRAHWSGPELIDFTGELSDFADTAAFIENLDLVISVDTSVAHLAGAMGKPVWIMNRFDSCWRWLYGRDDSPWYPTARLYRQHRYGDWDEVIERVTTDLERLAARVVASNASG
jgi:tetratricopeptide (TPR) repeat protein